MADGYDGRGGGKLRGLRMMSSRWKKGVEEDR